MLRACPHSLLPNAKHKVRACSKNSSFIQSVRERERDREREREREREIKKEGEREM
jgi:hypothetical protein